MDALGISLDQQQLEKLISYLSLIYKWNKTHNLTAITSLDEMVVKHLLDSLSLLPYIDQTSLLDVGAGAGLPSIPIAIANNQVLCTALDSSHKRTVFMRTAARELELENLEVVHSKAQDFKGRKFPLICSRAFSSLKNFVTGTEHLLESGGCWLAMKGQEPGQERDDLPASVNVVREIALTVPGLQAQRRLVILKKSG